MLDLAPSPDNSSVLRNAGRKIDLNICHHETGKGKAPYSNGGITDSPFTIYHSPFSFPNLSFLFHLFFSHVVLKLSFIPILSTIKTNACLAAHCFSHSDLNTIHRPPIKQPTLPHCELETPLLQPHLYVLDHTKLK